MSTVDSYNIFDIISGIIDLCEKGILSSSALAYDSETRKEIEKKRLDAIESKMKKRIENEENILSGIIDAVYANYSILTSSLSAYANSSDFNSLTSNILETITEKNIDKSSSVVDLINESDLDDFIKISDLSSYITNSEFSTSSFLDLNEFENRFRYDYVSSLLLKTDLDDFMLKTNFDQMLSSIISNHMIEKKNEIIHAIERTNIEAISYISSYNFGLNVDIDLFKSRTQILELYNNNGYTPSLNIAILKPTSEQLDKLNENDVLEVELHVPIKDNNAVLRFESIIDSNSSDRLLSAYFIDNKYFFVNDEYIHYLVFNLSYQKSLDHAYCKYLYRYKKNDIEILLRKNYRSIETFWAGIKVNINCTDDQLHLPLCFADQFNWLAFYVPIDNIQSYDHDIEKIILIPRYWFPLYTSIEADNEFNDEILQNGTMSKVECNFIEINPSEFENFDWDEAESKTRIFWLRFKIKYDHIENKLTCEYIDYITEQL